MNDHPKKDGIARRFPRRLLLMSSGAAVTAAAAELLSGGRAEAASVTTPWKLGGDTGVTTDGTNFLGPTNVAPLIFKTKASAGSPLSEKMRIQAGGFVGINVTAPTARLDVLHTGPLPAVQATNTNNKTGATGVTGICDSTAGPHARDRLIAVRQQCDLPVVSVDHL